MLTGGGVAHKIKLKNEEKKSIFFLLEFDFNYSDFEYFQCRCSSFVIVLGGTQKTALSQPITISHAHHFVVRV